MGIQERGHSEKSPARFFVHSPPLSSSLSLPSFTKSFSSGGDTGAPFSGFNLTEINKERLSRSVCFLLDAAGSPEPHAPPYGVDAWERAVGYTARNDGCTAPDQLEPAAPTDRPTCRPQARPLCHTVYRSRGSSSSPGPEAAARVHLPCGCVEPRTVGAARRRRERSADYPKVVPDKILSQALKSERIHYPQMACVFVCLCPERRNVTAGLRGGQTVRLWTQPIGWPLSE